MHTGFKVAYILHRFPYVTETFIMRELYWLREQGLDLTIFSLLPPKHAVVHEQARALLPLTRYSPYLSWQIIDAQRHFLWRSPGRYLRAFLEMVRQTMFEPTVLLRALALFPKSVYFARQIEALEIDHIHAHFVWLEGLAAGIAADLLDVTYTIQPHAFGLFSRNQRDVRRELEKASQVITISTYHRAYIADLCPNLAPEDIEIVYCGLEPERLQRNGSPPTGPRPDDDTLQILSVGRFVEKKGHEYLIDACALLAERGLNFRCRIAGGEDHERPALQARIERHGLQDYVELLGVLDQEQVLSLYQQSDIFALACVVAADGDRDGIPVVLMEAMACELPVVTTPMTGIPDLVEHGVTGLLVPERDP
ncbi:MAG: glycosyltransferase, partial [Anaerolineae bacterium]|nr:glycosyltransferase [Anaerolineae bacterium]